MPIVGITHERSTTAARGAGGARELGRLFTGGTCARRLLAAAFVVLLQAGGAAATRKTRKCGCARGKRSEEEEGGCWRKRSSGGLPRALSLSVSLSLSSCRSLPSLCSIVDECRAEPETHSSAGIHVWVLPLFRPAPRSSLTRGGAQLQLEPDAAVFGPVRVRMPVTDTRFC